MNKFFFIQQGQTIKAICTTFNHAVELANAEYLYNFPEIQLIHHLNKTLLAGSIEPADSRMHKLFPNAIYRIASIESYGNFLDRMAHLYSNENGINLVLSNTIDTDKFDLSGLQFIRTFVLNQWAR